MARLNKLGPIANRRCHLALLATYLIAAPCKAPAQSITSNQWTAVQPGFAVGALASSSSRIWAVGSSETIATSQDGEHWTVFHKLFGGPTLTTITVQSETFLYASASDGTLLTSTDSGKSWEKKSLGTKDVIQIALSEQGFGLLTTSHNVQLIQNWTASGPIDLTSLFDVKRFAQLNSPAVLNDTHAAFLASEGRYSEKGYVSTVDGGKTWRFYDPPSTGIGNFLAYNGRYWMVGNEVVGKENPGGGRAMASALTSTDAYAWDRSALNVTSCQMEGCNLCQPAGCLNSHTTLTKLFTANTPVYTFPSREISQWAIAGDILCDLPKENRWSHTDTSMRCVHMLLAQEKPQPEVKPIRKRSPKLEVR